MNSNLAHDSIGKDELGKDVFLKDIWPSQNDIADVISSSLNPQMFRDQYEKVVDGPQEWQNLTTSSSLNFSWDNGSTYIQRPPYFDDFSKDLPLRLDMDSDKLERELILKQLLYLRQDVNELK